jgi:hypothetical protein
MGTSLYEPALRRILRELRPYLDEVVIIGGWVPYLYRRYGGIASWAAGLSLTAEVDVLVDRPLSAGERPTVPEILRASGFHPDSGVGRGAVWLGDLAAGERVEFLVPHTGTAHQQGMVVPIALQGGMGAISLPGLELLRRYRRTLRIPVATPGGDDELQVWVPLLGAYVVNKACTFLRRQAHADGDNLKRAKDLLYLRDIAAAGPEVADHVARDLRRLRQDRPAANSMREAANKLRLALTGSAGGTVTQAAAMLRERETGGSEAAAENDVRGSLTDLLEILEEVLGPRRR